MKKLLSKILQSGLVLSLLTFSITAHAQTQSGGAGSLNTGPIQNLADSLIGIINTVVVPVVFAIAFIVFLWGVFSYFILGGANEEKRTEGSKFVFSAVIGFVVMVSIWGLVNLVGSALPNMSNQRPSLPTFGNTAPAQSSAKSGQLGGTCGTGASCSRGLSCVNGSCVLAKGSWGTGSTNVQLGQNVGDSCSVSVGCRDGLACTSSKCEPAGNTTAPVDPLNGVY